MAVPSLAEPPPLCAPPPSLSLPLFLPFSPSLSGQALLPTLLRAPPSAPATSPPRPCPAPCRVHFEVAQGGLPMPEAGWVYTDTSAQGERVRYACIFRLGPARVQLSYCVLGCQR